MKIISKNNNFKNLHSTSIGRGNTLVALLELQYLQMLPLCPENLLGDSAVKVLIV